MAYRTYPHPTQKENRAAAAQVAGRYDRRSDVDTIKTD